MSELREVALLIPLALLVLLPVTLAQPGPPAWSATLGASSVAQGSQLEILVLGPPNGTFTVTLSAFPFNGSPPDVEQSFVLPDQAVLANDTAEGIARLNTTYLGVWSFQVQITDGGTPFFFGVVNITIPLNSTGLADQVQNLTLQSDIITLRQNSLLYGQGQEQTDYWVVVAYATAWGVISVVISLFTGYSVGGTPVIRRVRAWIHDRHHTTDYVQNTGPWHTKPTMDRPLATARYECRRCSRVIGSQDDVVAHCRVVEGVAAPAIGLDYMVTGEGARQSEGELEASGRRTGPPERRRPTVPSVDFEGTG